jgi:putative radical SAM enzyme (TIGR03279 family)
MTHAIRGVIPGSIAEELGIAPGDELVAINGREVTDVLDYIYLSSFEYLEITIRKKDGQEWIFEIEKDVDEELGLDFEVPLMDRERHCANHCIFCFIDQLPPHTRPTMHVKDDDWRLSFLMGNYVTLTNVSERDIDRILERRISPLYISVHTTNPELRKKMMRNSRADKILELIDRFCRAGIHIHCQIVLCRGWNDGYELDRTISDLWKLRDGVRSVAVVPVGLTGYRQGLEPLVPYNQETALEVVEQIERWQRKFKKEENRNFVFAADEFYVLSHKEVPPYESYEDFSQLENGVGLIAKLEREFWDALDEVDSSSYSSDSLSIVTGESAFGIIRKMASALSDRTGKLIQVYPISNRFFGGQVTVAGLVTGGDIIEQLKGKDLGNEVLIPEVMLKGGQNVFLDDVSLEKLEKELGVPVVPVPVDGRALVKEIVGKR